MTSIRRILVVQPYGLGDALFITPILRAIRTLPTVEAVDLLLGSRTEPVFQNNPHVDRIFSIDKGKWHASGRLEIIKELISLRHDLGGRYDLLIDFSIQREYGFYGKFFFSVPKRIGFDFKHRGTFLTHKISLPNGFEGRHVVDFYSELINLIGLEVEDRFLEFYMAPADRLEAARILEQKSVFRSSHFVAVAPGGGESWGRDAVFKRWPIAHFVESLRFLKERIDFEGIVVLGSRDERGLGEEIERELGESVVNLCGEISLGVSAAILEKAVLLFANDGGLVHLAHALHLPLVAFYGPVDPRVYGPYPPSPRAISVVKEGLPCRPCYNRFRYNSACPDRECLTALSPNEVFQFLDKRKFWSAVLSPSLGPPGNVSP